VSFSACNRGKPKSKKETEILLWLFNKFATNYGRWLCVCVRVCVSECAWVMDEVFAQTADGIGVGQINLVCRPALLLFFLYNRVQCVSGL